MSSFITTKKEWLQSEHNCKSYRENNLICTFLIHGKCGLHKDGWQDGMFRRYTCICTTVWHYYRLYTVIFYKINCTSNFWLELSRTVRCVVWDENKNNEKDFATFDLRQIVLNDYSQWVFFVVTMAYNGGENNDNNNKSSCYSNTVAILLFNACKCYINRAVL